MLLAFLLPRCMYLADFGISKSSEDAGKLQALGILAGQISTAIKTGGTQGMLHELWGGTLSGEFCGSWVAWFPPKQLSQHTLMLGNKEPASALLGLDLFWLVLRSAFYHSSEGIDSSFHHPSRLGVDYAALRSAWRREFIIWRLRCPSIRCTFILGTLLVLRGFGGCKEHRKCTHRIFLDKSRARSRNCRPSH